MCRVMTSAPGTLATVRRHAAYAMAVPTPEHFLPLAYLAGLCEAAGETAQPFAEGGTMGSLTMTSYTLGLRAPGEKRGDGSDGSSMPDPARVPPEQTNI